MKATGYFGQELKVGDRIIFMARSGRHYLKDCIIHSMEEVISHGWNYDPTTKKSSYGPYADFAVKIRSDGEKYNYKTKMYEKYEYIKRIYNWKNALTIENDKVII